MFLLNFDTIEAFESHYKNPAAYTTDKCKCGGIREMQLSKCKITIADYEILLHDCPILVCQTCGEKKLGNLVPKQLYYQYFEMIRESVRICTLTVLNVKKFDFAKNMNLIYDCRDLNIPGLSIDLDPTHSPGFSCPVFFEKKVLNNFLLDDNYGLELFSESYGTIGKKGTDGWEWDWLMNFGINSNGKVVLFLGDIDQIDDNDKAVYWLKSYNIESDHTIVDSELYQAQFNCKFSNPIIEKQLVKLRNSFFKKISQNEGLDLFHLEEAVEQSYNELKKPINFTKEEIKNNIVLLDNMLNDAINQTKLRELYMRRVSPLPYNYNQLRTIKLLQGILSTKLSDEEVNYLISPLFNLKDLRDCFSHILPQDKVLAIKEAIAVSYQLDSFEEYEKMYDTLLKRLLKLFAYLNFAEI